MYIDRGQRTVMKEKYSGIKDSCDTINAYIVHMGGDYKKVFERVQLEKINKPTSFKGLHDLHLGRKRLLLPKFKKYHRQNTQED